MKPVFSHDLTTSFFLWYDNFLMKKGEAFKTYTTKFYNYQDPRMGGGKVIYGSPYKQWVYDQSISGVVIPSGVTINGSFVETGVSGMFFDFENGRVIFDSGVSTGLDITGTYSVKELNTYITAEPEEKIIIENKYIHNSRFSSEERSIAPHQNVTPACFMSFDEIKNKPFSFGGEDETKTDFKCIILAENIFQLDGVLSIFADSSNEVFSKIPTTKHPIGEFGSLKSSLYPSGYNYETVNQEYNSEYFFISDVYTSKMRDSVSREINPNIFIGFVEFEIKCFRYPRI